MTHSRPAVRPIFGRDSELRTLSSAVREVCQGGHRVVEIAGDPGIGKTQLLEELARDARGNGLAVRYGRATEADRQVPVAVVVEAMDDHIGALDQARLDELGTDAVGALAGVFPSMARRVGRDAPAAIAAEPAVLFRAVRALLEVSAGGSGLALLLDDAHWFDASSAALASYLLRHPPQASVLLVIAHRPRQAVSSLAAALAAAARRGTVQSVELGPLPMDAAGALLGTGWSRARQAELYRDSGGNPLYLEVLAASRRADAGGDTPVDAGCPSQRLTVALRAELVALPARLRLVAQAAAVAGDPFDPVLVAAVAGLGESATLAALDVLAERDLIRQSDSSALFRFRHPVVRQVAYHAAGAGWRLAGHTRAAHALAERGAQVVARAPHLARCAHVGDLAAVELLAAAAAVRQASVPAAAAGWLRTALRLLPDGADQAMHRVTLLVALAEALSADGRLADSDATLEEALRRLPGDGQAVRAGIVAARAAVKRQLGDYAQAGTLALDELAKLADPTSRQAVALKLEYTMSTLLGGVREPEQAPIKDAVQGAVRCGDHLLQATSLAVAGVLACIGGDLPAATTAVDDAASLLGTLPDAELSGNLDGTVWVGWGLIYLARPTAALRHVDRALELARATSRGSWLPRLLTVAGRAHTQLGELTLATGRLEEAVELVVDSASPASYAMTLTAYCQLLTVTGDLPAALDVGRKATEATDRAKGRWWTFAWMALAEARLLAGDAQGCIDALAIAGGGPELPSVVPPQRAEICELVVRAELALGRPAHAAAWAQRATEAADKATPSAAGYAELAHAQVLIARNPAGAVQRAAAAVAALLRGERRLDAVRARSVLGVALGAAGRRARACAELSRVEQLLVECGANGLLPQVGNEQRRLGRLPSGPASPPVHTVDLSALTRRETQVADLVAGGHTNRQIAHRLGVSEKTVEAHLGRVFHKLGVSSRAAVASLVARTRRPDRFLGEGA